MEVNETAVEISVSKECGEFLLTRTGIYHALRGRVASLAHENAELNGALAQASEQQRATSEILSVVARSRTDVQSVLDTVCRSAAQLCEAYDASVWRPDGDRRRPQPEDAVGKRIWSRPRAAHAQPLKRHGRATIAY